MIAMSIAEVVRQVSGRLYCDGEFIEDVESVNSADITGVVTDSRQVTDGILFVAIAGERVDGHSYVSAVADSGAVAALVEHPVENAAVAQIVVENTVKALGLVAALNIQKRKALISTGRSPFTIVGITGSVGKTTTKDLVKTLLSTQGKTVAPQGSFNNDIGLPLTALQVEKSTRFLVAEMGASAIGEIKYLTSIAPPDVSVVLKVGVAHLGGFGSVDNIRTAKSEIVQALKPGGIAILNADDANVRQMAAVTSAQYVIWFSSHPEAEVKAELPELRKGVQSVLIYADEISVNSHDCARFTLHLPYVPQFAIQLQIPGEHNVMNALAAAAVAYTLDVPEHIIGQGLAFQRQISAHRMAISRVHHGEHANFTVIDDSFNANPDSMCAGLNGLAHWNTDFEGNAGKSVYRVAVLGAMLELGSDEERAHKEIGAYAAAIADEIISVGSSTNQNLQRLAQCLSDGADSANDARETDEADVADGTDKTQTGSNSDSHESSARVHTVSDTREAEAIVDDIAARHKNTVVLLKGSHASGLSTLATHWTPTKTTGDSQGSVQE